MTAAPLDTVVLGAGHVGLAVSRRLADAGIDHVVLEDSAHVASEVAARRAAA